MCIFRIIYIGSNLYFWCPLILIYSILCYFIHFLHSLFYEYRTIFSPIFFSKDIQILPFFPFYYLSNFCLECSSISFLNHIYRSVSSRLCTYQFWGTSISIFKTSQILTNCFSKLVITFTPSRSTWKLPFFYTISMIWNLQSFHISNIVITKFC